jgi:hypothetical protein
MNTRTTGLASFVKRPGTPAPSPATTAAPPTADPVSVPAAAAAPSTTGAGNRSRGQKPVVSMTFRLPRKDWERLHQLAIAEGMSINSLALRGLSRLFEERGLPGIGNPED